MALSTTWTTGTGNPKIVYPSTGSPTLTLDLTSYSVEMQPDDKTKNIIQERESADYSRNDLLIGRVFEYEFNVIGISSTDLTNWMPINGQLVKFYPHVDKTSDYLNCLAFLDPFKFQNPWTDAIRFRMIGVDVI